MGTSRTRGHGMNQSGTGGMLNKSGFMGGGQGGTELLNHSSMV
jgi:hypothetical protein